MKSAVITGGPCSGKTTICNAIKEEFGEEAIPAPEVATMLLSSGFPVPGRDLPWSQDWQDAFQGAVLPVQTSIENAFKLKANGAQRRILICDRGVLDGAAYTQGGLEEFCKRYNVDLQASLRRYSAVIHLESLATADPGKYGKTGNNNRFEPLERAQELELATQQVWKSHPRHIMITGKRGIEGKMSEVFGIIRFLLAEKTDQ